MYSKTIVAEELNEHTDTNELNNHITMFAAVQNILTRTCSTIFLICGSKPMSSIRSASSRTRYVVRCRLVLRASSRSINLPGVAMQISAPQHSNLTTDSKQS